MRGCSRRRHRSASVGAASSMEGFAGEGSGALQSTAVRSHPRSFRRSPALELDAPEVVPAHGPPGPAGYGVNVALTAVMPKPSESACWPSMVTSGANNDLSSVLLLTSSMVILQSFGVVSNRLR